MTSDHDPSAARDAVCPVHVVCFGNLLQGDDGFGIHVYRRLCEDGPISGARVFDAGITGMGALSHFEGCRHVVVVDALEFMGHEGRVHRLTLGELAGPEETFSAHALDVNHLFHVLPIVFEGRAVPQIVVIGAEIKVAAGLFSMDLSPPLARAVEETVALVRDEVAALR